MKKAIFVIFGLLLATSSHATHLMGGQITATYLGADTTGVHYAVDFTAYRDTIGIQISPNATFYISKLDTSGLWSSLFSSTVSFDTTSGNLMPSVTVYGVEVYSYLDTITLPGDGYYSITWDNCCRNVAIINMSSPGSESLALATYIMVDSLNINSSPSYLTPPVAYLPVDTLWQYNPLPFDPDGDSLVWTMVTPLDDNGLVSGYEFLSDTSFYSNVSGIFSLDSITGALSWNPSMVGNFVASFEISEWRNGVYMGKMRRDMQFIVVPDTGNYIAQISNMQSIPTNSGGYPYIKINPGINYQLHLLGNDANPNDILKMEAYGESFELATSPSLFSFTTTGNGNEIEGTFSWMPEISHVRPAPYLTVFRTSDHMFYFDNTIQFEVTLGASTEIKDIESLSVNELYPNPTNNYFNLSVALEESEDIYIEMYNILGVLISKQKLSLSSGNHIIVKNFDLNSGQYFVNVTDIHGLTISTNRLLVVK